MAKRPRVLVPDGGIVIHEYDIIEELKRTNSVTAVAEFFGVERTRLWRFIRSRGWAVSESGKWEYSNRG